MKKVVMFSILLLCSVVLFAGPFGLEMGWTKQDLIENDVEILLEEGNAFLVAPPAPHSSFDTYLVDIDLDFGLYTIIAISDSISTSENGQQFLSEYNNIKKQLTTSYGEPTNDINRLSYGSIWDEPQDFMMSLLKKDRTIGCTWNLGEENNGMKIALMPIAESLSSGNLTLMYTSPKFDEIQARKDAKEASVL